MLLEYFVLGYLIIVLIFLVLRFFYHILHGKSSREKLLYAVKMDFINLYAYAKQIILTHPKKFKILLVISTVLIVLPLVPYKIEILYVVYDVLSTVMCFLLVMVFAPQKDSRHQGFPVEIFGFTYAIIVMFYNAGCSVFDIFYTNDFLKEDMWIYGYGITAISYGVCIATLRGFMERKLSTEEIVLLGMIMLTTLEFITYYGIGFFSAMKFYNSDLYESTVFGNLTNTINQGIYVASQSQILERTNVEIWGSIILNGSDVLTITAVLGYVMQKFMDNE